MVLLHCFFILLVSSLKSCSSVRVIEFKSNINPRIMTSRELQLNGMEGTSEISFCLKFMVRYRRGHKIIGTRQFSLWLQNDEDFKAYFHYEPWNATSVNDEYSRMFFLNQTYIPGQWVSICIALKLMESIQQLTVYQGGVMGFQETFTDGKFDRFFFKSSRAMSATDL